MCLRAFCRELRPRTPDLRALPLKTPTGALPLNPTTFLKKVDKKLSVVIAGTYKYNRQGITESSLLIPSIF